MKEKKFFSESNGEIYMNKAECVIYEVRISETLKPTFTDNFISALKKLETAAKTPESPSSKLIINDFFTREFGTHYMSDVFMGASLTTENRFVGSTSNSKLRNQRKKCSTNTFAVSGGVGFRGVEVKAERETHDEKCDEDETNKEFFSENKFSEFNVIEKGSTPGFEEAAWIREAIIF